MEFLKNFFKNPLSLGIGSTIISGFDFFTHLTAYLSDGKLDAQEISSLLSLVGGTQFFILVVLLFKIKEMMDKKDPENKA